MKIFPLIPSQFDALRSKLLTMGVTLPSGSDGLISYSNIDLKYHYDGAKLTLSVVKKPFLIAESLIWEKVGEWINA